MTKVSRPASDTVSGPSSTVSPPRRTNGTKTATNSTSGSTTLARDQIVRGPTPANAAAITSATAHPA